MGGGERGKQLQIGGGERGKQLQMGGWGEGGCIQMKYCFYGWKLLIQLYGKKFKMAILTNFILAMGG